MRPIRYALWSLLFIIPLGFALLLLAGALLEPPGVASTDLAPLTSILAVTAFMLTALIAPGVVDPEAKALPAWTTASIIAGFGQLAALFCIYQDTASAWSAVYVPSIVVCLNLTALVLVHVWVACEGFRFPAFMGFSLGGISAGWVIKAGSSTAFGAFHLASAILFVAAFAAGIVYALATRDEPAPSRN